MLSCVSFFATATSHCHEFRVGGAETFREARLDPIVLVELAPSPPVPVWTMQCAFDFGQEHQRIYLLDVLVKQLQSFRRQGIDVRGISANPVQFLVPNEWLKQHISGRVKDLSLRRFLVR